MKRIKSIISINQNRIIKNIQTIDKKIIILKSKPLTSKTTILKKIFEKSDYSEKIFISGCNPEYMNYINESLINQIDNIVKNIGNEKILICLDEFYDEKIMNYFSNLISKVNILIIITTNNSSIKSNENIEFINIYPWIFKKIAEKTYELYDIDLEKEIEYEKMSLKELNLLIKHKIDNNIFSDIDKKRIDKTLNKEYEKRNEPFMTYLLYVGTNIDMLVNYNCDKLRS